MELKIYKGFDAEYLKCLDFSDALISDTIEEKINVLLFDTKKRKQLDSALTLMEDNDSKWVTYEEYALIKDRVALCVVDYGLIATVISNNLYADVFPLQFNISDNCFEEIKKIENGYKTDDISDEAKKITAIWNDKLLVDTKSTLVFINSFLFYNV